MFERLREGLEHVHFLYGDKADALMHALRHLIGRAQPTPMEVDVLIGLRGSCAGSRTNRGSKANAVSLRRDARVCPTDADAVAGQSFPTSWLQECDKPSLFSRR